MPPACRGSDWRSSEHRALGLREAAYLRIPGIDERQGTALDGTAPARP